MLVADIAGMPHALGKRQVIFLQLDQDVFRCEEIRMIILDTLYPGDVANQVDRLCRGSCVALSAMSSVIRENLRGLLIKKEAIIREIEPICANGSSCLP